MTMKQTAPLSLKEATALLINYHDIHEGLWSISFGINVGIGQVGPNPKDLLPGAMIGISNISLSASEKEGPHVVDAAVVNPITKPPGKSSVKPPIKAKRAK